MSHFTGEHIENGVCRRERNEVEHEIHFLKCDMYNNLRQRLLLSQLNIQSNIELMKMLQLNFLKKTA